MKSKAIAIVLFWMLIITANGQNTELDKIILTDKTSYTGKVVSQKPGEYIRLVLENSKDTLLILMEKIEEISKVKGVSNVVTTQKTSIETQRYNSHRFQTSLSYYQGGGDVRFIGFGLGIQYWLSSAFAFGVSASYLGETGSGAGRPYQWQKVPLIVESLYEYQKYSDNRMALYAKLGVGYSFTLNGTYYDNFLEEEYKVTNGFLFNPALGFRFNATKNLGGRIEGSYLLIIDQNKKASGEQVSQLNWNAAMLKLSLLF